ncbi:Phosphate regulon sensor protein PhoR (SphS) [hydrothermal vent metagenome]|uniref:histidine kinase n=1 Tax=hydrothermal vent metagenome TaxID=652676 RepID=A0A3B0YGI6_9ZZZZ
MTNPWQSEIQRILGLVLIGLLLGVLFGSLVVGLLVPLTAYLGWHLYNMYRLVRWLREGKRFQPPESSGIWDEVFEQIFRLQQRNRKRKRSLRRLLKRFHKITVALPDATVELRPNSDEIEWWNKAATRYLGFEFPRDTGQRISNLMRNPDFLTYMQAGEGQGEIEIPSPCNDEVTLRVRIIRYSKNRRLLIARDVTRLQRLERTRQDFVANVSHELRSPLTVVIGYLETLLDEDADEIFATQLRSMRLQTERMNGIVNDLMLLSRLESDDPQKDTTNIAVSRLIDTVTEHARALSSAAEHVITLDVDRDLCIHGHESELYSVFSNLVLNAVSYTPAGGLIHISWKKRQGDPVFSVKDSGAGIASHHIPRLTERFYRVDAGRSRASGGTGLGLAIVKHVLLRHEGRLEIDSEPGKGSVFSCHFPPERVTGCPRAPASTVGTILG